MPPPIGLLINFQAYLLAFLTRVFPFLETWKLHLFIMKESIKILYQKFVRNAVTRAELKEVLAFLKNTNKEDWRKITRSAKKEADPGVSAQEYTEAFEDVFSDVLADIEKDEDGSQSLPRTSLKEKKPIALGYKIAAAVAAIVTVAWVLFSLQSEVEDGVTMLTYETRAGQKSTITLADGSTVRLNSQSKLSYPETFRHDAREVRLEGEAFFEVKKNKRKPFIVKSGNVVTTVLGTSFNVNSYPAGKVAVTVATGKVKVAFDTSTPQENSVLLTPNQQAIANNNSIEKNNVTPGQYLAWIDNKLLFEEAPISEVVQILERWYGTHITLKNEKIGHCLLSAEFKNKSLAEIFQLIKLGKQDLQYEFVNDSTGQVNVIIDGDGC